MFLAHRGNGMCVVMNSLFLRRITTEMGVGELGLCDFWCGESISFTEFTKIFSKISVGGQHIVRPKKKIPFKKILANQKTAVVTSSLLGL